MKKVYAGFDVAKVILAFFVVAIHIHPFEGMNNPFLDYLSIYLFSMAVPFFFAMTGYLLFQKEGKLNDQSSHVRSYIWKTIKLYVLANVLYLPATFTGFRIWNIEPQYRLKVFVNEFLFVGEHYLSWPFWYLLATIYGLFVIYLLLKFHVPTVGILLVGMASYRFSDVLTYWISHLDTLSGWKLEVTTIAAQTVRSGRMFTSILFLAIGMILARSQYLKKVQWGIRLFVFLLVSVVYLLHPAGYVYMIGRPFMVFSGIWFLSAIQVPDCLLYHVLREFSLVLYVCHMLFQFIWTECTHNPSAGGWTPYWFAICGCVLVTGIRVTRKEEWKRSREFAKTHSINVRI